MAATDTSEKPKDQQLKELLAAASHDYALKSYDQFADLYAQAAEIQDEINGEMNPANAELLYAYGRCLHHLAVSNSDVLGGKVAGEGASAKKSGKKRKRGADSGEGSSTAARGAVAKEPVQGIREDAFAEKIVEKAVENTDGMQVKEEETKAKQESKPFFQITGDDEEWEDDEEDVSTDDEAADEEEDEAEDDFATAFEVLDVARVLLSRQIDQLQGSEDATNPNPEVAKQVWASRDRLADTHDLQAEISLENERFTDAITDSRASLTLKQQLFEPTHGQISEAHFKLSLALELGSVTTPKDDNGMPIEGAPQEVDQAMRQEAAKEMESAIASTKLRLEKETKAMKQLTGDELKKKQAEKKDVEEIVGEMEQRLDDLRNQPVSVNSAAGPAGAAMENNLGGILGEMLGESPQALKARIEEASKGANDLTGMVKHKKKPKAEGQASSGTNGDVKGKGKRKLGDEASEDELAGDSKRIKSPAA